MIQLYQDDCLSVMASLPAGSVDAVITDPPYRVISGGTGESSAMHGRGDNHGILNRNDGKIFDHNDTPISAYAGELFRLLTAQSHCWMFCNEMNRRPFEDEMLKAGFRCHGIFPWVKQNATPNRWGMKNWEPVFLFRKGPARTLYTPSLKQALHYPNPVGTKLHPTQKPVDLLRCYVAASTKPREVVFDPFMGSGSTGIAAMLAGRHFIGIEKDPKYFEIARERLGFGTNDNEEAVAEVRFESVFL
jgi:DNA modification methylase